MDLRAADLIPTAMTPYRLNLRAGDRVLIVADTATDPLVVEAFTAAALALDVEPMVAITKPIPHHHADISPMVAAAADEADLVHLITSKGSLHGPSNHAKQSAGKRYLASEEITASMLREGAATADYERMNELAAKLYAIMMEGSEIHITTAEGTDLRGDIGGRPCWITAGRVLENPGVDIYACAFPDGEVGVAPIEETIEGTVVWDTSMHQVGLIREPIRARIEGGRAVEISGGAEAATLRSYLEESGDDGSWIVGETAIGINDKARVTGRVREDKKLAGSVHVALGMNTDTGGTVASKTHVDGILRRPTVTIDGRIVVEAGRLAVEA